jgi:hypothetical protein
MPAQAPLTAAMIGLGIDSGKARVRLDALLQAALADRLQLLHVRARAEASAGACHHDHAHGLVLGALREQREVRVLHLSRPRVEAIRAVEGQQRHTPVHVHLHDFALRLYGFAWHLHAHALLPPLVLSRPSSLAPSRATRRAASHGRPAGAVS